MNLYLYTYYDNTLGWKHTKLWEYVSPSSITQMDAKFKDSTGKNPSSPFIHVTVQPA